MKKSFIFAAMVVAITSLTSNVCFSQLPQLEKPFRVEAAGKVIDLTGSGHAAPYVFDFNGDGKKDIIIGEFSAPMSKELQAKYDAMSEEQKKAFVKPFGGKARIYINSGSDKSPVFGDYTYLQAGGTDAGVLPSCCIGFDPFFMDLDGDGTRDVTSGEYFGGFIHFYKGIKGKPFEFEAPVDIAQPDTILLSKRGMNKLMRTANFIDFDKDGDYDMVWGNVMGEVYYSQNLGDKKRYEFSNSSPVTINGLPLYTDGKSDPLPVDWDGDGIVDLLVGTEAADIIFYKGKAKGSIDFEQGISIWTSRAYPGGAKPSYLKIKESMDALGANRPYPGYRVRLGVVDWNNDNKLDLLVGNTFVVDEKGKNSDISGNVYVFLRK
ncbi:MAG: hypothetical protein CVU13_10485 [Bacteroidetes bacterium HGW-Bacteroidetes-8]|jgi:hypothetical protein|nr:MAG: hypothetical protein CVU13_10485 [Bacteroidetes bacterium HGW-Bacteroidetes-8]